MDNNSNNNPTPAEQPARVYSDAPITPLAPVEQPTVLYSDMALPPVEQVVAPKRGGINVATFIVSLLVVAAAAGFGGWFIGNNNAYAAAQSDFRTNPQTFIQSACSGGGCSGFGAFGGGGAGGAGGTGGTGTNGGNTGGTGGTGTRRFAGGGGTAGKITAINGNTVTVETTEKSVTVNLSGSTTVTKVDKGATSDLKVGDRITVIGAANGDAIDAANIIVGNITGIFGGRGLGGAGGAPSGTPGTNP